MKVKNDHRSKFFFQFKQLERRSLKKIRASTGFEPMTSALPVRCRLLGTLRSEDGDGRENDAEKVKSHSFNLHRNYSKSLTLSNVGEPSKS